MEWGSRARQLCEIVEASPLVLLIFGNPDLLPVWVRVERDIELSIDVFQFGRDCLEIASIG
jgi:hypothetical protein